jgi:hypothetical protein
MKTLHKYISLAALALFVGGAAVHADEFDANYGKLISKWQKDRDDLVFQVVQGWLRGASTEVLTDDLRRLIQLDVRLATDPSIELYVTSFTEPENKDKCISEIVIRFMRNKGVEFDSSKLFAGRTFYLLKEDARPDFRFMKWEEQK